MFSEAYDALDRYIQTAIAGGAALLIGFIVRIIILHSIRMASNRTDDVILDSIHKRIKGSWLLFIPFVLFLILFPRDGFSANTYDQVKTVFGALIIGSIALLAFRLVNVIQDVIINRYDIKKEDNVKERKIRTQLSFIKKVMKVIIVILAVSMILLSIEEVRQYGAALVTSAGVAGIIIGFAAQKSLANLLAGFQIAFTQPIKIDDAVVIEGEWGWIEEINLTYGVIRIWDLRRLIVPITYFIEKPFQNWTRVTADLIGSVFLYVDYTVPLDKLREAFNEVLKKSKLWDGKASVLQVTESTEKSMQIRLLMSARNSPEAWDLRCEVREEMIDFIQKNYPDGLPRFRILDAPK